MKIKSAFLLLVVLSFSPTAFAARALFEFEEDHVMPMVYINIVADVGAAHDPSNKQGLANLGSNMMLRGTKTLKKLQFLSAVDKLGASINADVRSEGTVIRIAVLSENLQKMLDLISTVLLEPALDEAELKKLQSEVIGGILMEKSNDARLATRHFQRYIFGAHPYGNVINGTEKGVSAVTIGDIRNYYVSHFGQDTLSLFGSGDANASLIRGWWSQLTAKLMDQNPRAAAAPAIAEPEIAPGRRGLIVDKPQSTQAQILMGHKGPRPEIPGFYAIQVANQAYGGHSFQATLMKEVREKRGWTYGISNNFRYSRTTSYYATHLFPKTTDAAPAVGLVISLYEDFVKNGIKQNDFEFAQLSLVNRAPFNFDTPRKRLENATAEYLYNFPRGYFRDFAGNVKAVNYQDVQPALQGFFHPENISMVVVGKAKDVKSGVSKLPGFSAPETKPYTAD